MVSTAQGCASSMECCSSLSFFVLLPVVLLQTGGCCLVQAFAPSGFAAAVVVDDWCSKESACCVVVVVVNAMKSWQQKIITVLRPIECTADEKPWNVLALFLRNNQPKGGTTMATTVSCIFVFAHCCCCYYRCSSLTTSTTFFSYIQIFYVSFCEGFSIQIGLSSLSNKSNDKKMIQRVVQELKARMNFETWDIQEALPASSVCQKTRRPLDSSKFRYLLKKHAD